MDRTQRWVGLLLGILVLAVLIGVSYRVLDQHVIESRRPEPEVAPRPSLGVWGREEVVKLAARVPLADVTERTVMPPPLEIERQEREGAATTADVRITGDFECGVPIDVSRVSDSRYAVHITAPGERTWFMFRVEGVPEGGKLLRIDISGGNLSHWRSLNPVYSYTESLADLMAFGAVEGVSHSTAHNGPLVPDKTASGWHYIPDSWVDGGRHLSIVRFFERDAYVAMRTPYTPGLEQNLVQALQGREGVEVIEVGKSDGGRPLHVFKLGTADPVRARCVVIYAREHANEHDSSWVAKGAIEFLTSGSPAAKQILSDTTFLITPLLDPDGAAVSQYEGITHSFYYTGREGESARAYAKFFKNWVDQGRPIDIVFNVHNVQSGEAPHLSCARMEESRIEHCKTLHRKIRDACPELTSTANAWGTQPAEFRLGGYLSVMYGALHMAYEVNSQDR